MAPCARRARAPRPRRARSLSLGGYARSPLRAPAGGEPRPGRPPAAERRDRTGARPVGEHDRPPGGVPQDHDGAARRAPDGGVRRRATRTSSGIVDFDIAPQRWCRCGGSHPAQRSWRSTTPSTASRPTAAPTSTGPARRADGILRERRANRHMILLSDGISQPQDYAALLARVRGPAGHGGDGRARHDVDGPCSRDREGDGRERLRDDRTRASCRGSSSRRPAEREAGAGPRASSGAVAGRQPGRPLARRQGAPGVTGNVVTTLSGGAGGLIASGGCAHGGSRARAMAVRRRARIAWTPGTGGPVGHRLGRERRRSGTTPSAGPRAASRRRSASVERQRGARPRKLELSTLAGASSETAATSITGEARTSVAVTRAPDRAASRLAPSLLHDDGRCLCLRGQHGLTARSACRARRRFAACVVDVPLRGGVPAGAARALDVHSRSLCEPVAALLAAWEARSRSRATRRVAARALDRARPAALRWSRSWLRMLRSQAARSLRAGRSADRPDARARSSSRPSAHTTMSAAFVVRARAGASSGSASLRTCT